MIEACMYNTKITTVNLQPHIHAGGLPTRRKMHTKKPHKSKTNSEISVGLLPTYGVQITLFKQAQTTTTKKL